MKKFDVVQLMSIGGMVLGFASTALTSISKDKKMEELIEKKVQEAIENFNK